MNLTEMNLDELKELILNSKSRRQILDSFGLKGNGNANLFLSKIIRDNNIDISHFSGQKDFTEIKLENISDCYSYKDIGIKLGLTTQDTSMSSNLYLKIKRYLEKENFDTSHFNDNGRYRNSQKRNKLKKVFCEKSTASHSYIKSRFIKERCREYACDICNTDKWLDQPLTLQLDHKNGIRDDNRKENLQLICPNCHSQTSTFGGKNCKR